MSHIAAGWHMELFTFSFMGKQGGGGAGKINEFGIWYTHCVGINTEYLDANCTRKFFLLSNGNGDSCIGDDDVLVI
jgi:hypothetical protein